jgi:DNA adenine methylase
MSRNPRFHEPIDATFDDVLAAVADENMPAIQAHSARPFIKWVGGKRSVLPELLARMPRKYATYCEPFMGGAALFFAERPEKAYLSDRVFPLVLTYIAVRDDVERLIRELYEHAAHHNKDYYLKARQKLATETDRTKIGAWMIYLNKTCYNGLWRVNKSGGFNVPMGSYTSPNILDEQNLRWGSKALESAEIHQHDFSQVPIHKGNFYYLDPPYHQVYASYDSSGFADDEHRELAKFCKKIDAGGGYFMVSNSDTKFVRTLYQGFTIEEIQAGRFVSCKGEGRGKETELVIRNYSERRESPADGERAGDVRGEQS